MEEVETQGPISEMPETILILIMSHLEFDEILRMTRINKMFNRYTKNKTLWEMVHNAYDQRHFGGKSFMNLGGDFFSDTRQKLSRAGSGAKNGYYDFFFFNL